MSTSTEAPWQSIARDKQAKRAALIPSKWTIPSHLLPKDPPRFEDGPQNVLNVPRQVLSRDEVAITEDYTISTLLQAISQRRLSSTQVAEAFCHRAAVAHQLTNCITEPLFNSALKRARELDDYLEQYGQPFGPLHGLPVSVKDTFNVAGVDSSIGLAALCFKPAEKNAPMVDLLLSLGCVIIAKTNIPQTLASLDSINNVFGRLMNPVNRLCTGGGSSGGEGVIVAMKGCMIGIGTDIGGSIRVPAMCNGVYGFKPSNGRLPYGGQASTSPEGFSRAGVQAVAGPISRSVEDMNYLMKELVPRSQFWGEDCIPGPWLQTKARGSGKNGEFVVGVLRSDGNCELLPPIARVIDEVAGKLRNTLGYSVVDLETPRAWTRCQSVMSKLMAIEGGGYMGNLIESTGEPLVPWMQTRFRKGKPKTLPEVAQIQAQRAHLEREMLKLWYEEDKHGRRTQRLDAIICPVAPHPVPMIEGYNAVGYTSSFVLIDYPTGVIPIRDCETGDLELGKPLGGKVLSSWDERNRELWDESKINRKAYLGTPLSVQVVVPRLEDEKLMQAMDRIDRVAKQGVSSAKSRL